MNEKNVIWLPIVREKLVQFRSLRFTPDELMILFLNLF